MGGSAGSLYFFRRRRNDLTGVASKEPPQVCRQCGQLLAKAPKRKERKFCSEACRRVWWKAHPELVDRSILHFDLRGM